MLDKPICQVLIDIFPKYLQLPGQKVINWPPWRLFPGCKSIGQSYGRCFGSLSESLMDAPQHQIIQLKSLNQLVQSQAIWLVSSRSTSLVVQSTLSFLVFHGWSYITQLLIGEKEPSKRSQYNLSPCNFQQGIWDPKRFQQSHTSVT